MQKKTVNPTRRDDQEFLPAALEIIETPPSPVRMAVIVFFAALVAFALAWTYFGRFDVIAIAQGKFQPPGRVKIVQPVEGGKVQKILATNGTNVLKNDVLVMFEDMDARAEVEALTFGASSLEAEVIRRTVGIDLVSRRKLDLTGFTTRAVWPERISQEIQTRELDVLKADIAQLNISLAANAAESRLKAAEQDSLNDMIAAQEALVKNIEERVEMRLALSENGAGSRASLVDVREGLLKEMSALVGYRGRHAELKAAIDVLSSQREQTVQTFITEYTQKLADASKAHAEIVQRLIKAKARFDHMTIRSPSDGVVQASMVYTVGQVVTPAQELMRIVPQDSVLEIEAYLPNKDIGFVRLGQDVAIKIDSFPWTRYGVLGGKISHIAKDAIPMADAAAIESSPAMAAEKQVFASAQRTQNLVFPITISVFKSEMVVDGRSISVSPGMTALVEVKTGSRRIIEYLFSPLLEVSSESMRER